MSDEYLFSSPGRSRRAVLSAVGIGTAAGAFSALRPAGGARGVEAAVSSVNGRTGDVVLTAADTNAVPAETLGRAVVIAGPVEFTGIDPTGSQSSSEGLNRAIRATPAGATLVIPPGRYLLDARLEVRNASMTIEASGAEFLLVAAPDGTPPTGALDVRGSFSDTVSVSSIVPSSVVIDSRELATFDLTLSAALPDLMRGSILRVFSDDPIIGSRPGAGGLVSRAGQFFTVNAVAGTQVSVFGEELLDPLTANVRAAMLRPFTFAMRGGRFTTDPAGLESWNAPTIVLRDLLAPHVSDVDVETASSQHLQLMGCYAYSIERCRFNYAPNDAPAGRLGYAILDNSCSYGRIHQVVARNVRHAYTDDTPRIYAGESAPGLYGRTFATHVSASVGHGTSGITWDTHSASHGVTFESCISIGSSPAGFGLRGRRHRVSNCEVVGASEGILFYTEAAKTDSWGHIVDGLTLRGIRKNAINATLDVTERRPSTLRNVFVEGSPQLMYVKQAALHLSDVLYQPTEALKDGAVAAIINGADVVAESLRFDYRSVVAGQQLIVATASNGAVVRLRDALVLSGSVEGARRFAYVVRGSNTSALSRFVLTGLVMDYGGGPDSNGPIANMTAIHADSICDWMSSDDTVVRSSTHYVWNTSTTTAEPNGANYISAALSRTTEYQLVIVFNVEFHSILFKLRNGRRPGQNLRIVNESTVKNLTVKNGIDNYNVQTLSGGDVVLKPGQAISLLWGGSVWRQLS